MGSRGSVHGRARDLFSWTDTSTLRAQTWQLPEYLGYERLERNRTLFSIKSSESLLRSLNREVESFVSGKSHTARRDVALLRSPSVSVSDPADPEFD